MGHWLYIWEDETSQFDPKGHWMGGSECHMRTYGMWIPNRIKKDDKDAIEEFIASQDETGPWASESEIQKAEKP